jgi:dUTP pyrophosphatase
MTTNNSELPSSSVFIENTIPRIQIVKNNPDAIIPSRANSTDIGLDLVAIGIYKVLDNGVILYDTGISASAPKGYYLEILPRSSLSKTGWMLANSVGVIDPSYRGNLLIALAKGSNQPEPISLPFCKCQLVLRKALYAEVEEVSSLSDTERGSGGFGSTGDRI